MLLQYELSIRQREQNVQAQVFIQSVLERFVRICTIAAAPDVPTWFISPDDLEFHGWNLVMEDDVVKYYDGKWRDTRVTVMTSSMPVDKFTDAATQWHLLSHPNVMKLYGACHVGSDRLFVFEAVPDTKPLLEFLRDASKRALTWQCLHQAALGLQYLHRRGVAHGCLCNETLIVGSDGVVKLNKVGEEIRRLRDALSWVAPEQWNSSEPCAPSDIYALGLCIWDAVGKLTPQIAVQFSNALLVPPTRPSTMTESEYDLIMQMCARDPSQRMDIAFVVRQLKLFAVEAERVEKGDTDDGASCAPSVKAKVRCWPEHADATDSISLMHFLHCLSCVAAICCSSDRVPATRRVRVPRPRLPLDPSRTCSYQDSM